MAQISEGIATKIQKLFAQAHGTDNEIEAAAFMARAQRLMREHNIDLATVNDSAVTATDAREKVNTDLSARYAYQRKLWQALCKVNYCWYYVTDIYPPKKEMTAQEKVYGFRFETNRVGNPKRRHTILGRRANVMAVQAMGEYLEDVLSRMTSQLRGSAVIAWKDGCVERLTERIKENFVDTEGMEGNPEDQALVLKALSDREHAGNYDFVKGEGAWARKLIADAKWEAEEKAKEEKAERDWLEYLANETPEQKAQRRKTEERNLRRSRSRSTGIRDYMAWEREKAKEAKRVSNEHYQAGRRAGESVSLNKQISESSRKQLA